MLALRRRRVFSAQAWLSDVRALKFLLLLGFGGVLLALVALLVTDTRMGAALACDRAAAVCSLTPQRLTQTWTGRLALTTIDRAEVRVRGGRGGPPQVWVVTTGGDYFFAAYDGRSTADDAAQQLNAFLREPSAAALKLSDDQRASYCRWSRGSWGCWAGYCSGNPRRPLRLPQG